MHKFIVGTYESTIKCSSFDGTLHPRDAAVQRIVLERNEESSMNLEPSIDSLGMPCIAGWSLGP